MDTDAAASLAAWAARATPAELRQGPLPSDLGGPDAVATAAAALAASPLFPYLVSLAGNDDSPGEARERTDRAVLDGIARHARHSSYASAITRLLAYPALAARLGRPLEQVLQRRAEDGAAPGADDAAAATGAVALQAWLHLCASRPAGRHRLLAFLTDLPATGTLPEPMTRWLPRVAGLAHEMFGEDDLLPLLRDLAALPGTEADAGFELALASLRRALDAGSLDGFTGAAADARAGFAAVEAAEEARHDARAYGAALDAIMAFSRSDGPRMREAAARLDAAVAIRTAWLSGGYLPAWTRARAAAEAAWLELSAILVSAAGTLDATGWYHPAQAIRALLDAHVAARSFTAAGAPGLALLIAPRIEGAFIRDASRLALLDHALDHDPLFTDDQAARELHAAVRAALAQDAAPRSAAGEEQEGDGGPGKAPGRLAALLHRRGIPNAADVADGMSQEARDAIEVLLWNDEIAESLTANAKIEDKLRDLQADLAASPDWRTAGGPFAVLLRQTILYLASRHDIGAVTGGDRTAFLRSKTPKTVLERELQQDYFEWIQQGPLYNTVSAEVINRAHGRADVIIRFPHVSFSVECKREQSDATRAGLRAYLGQAAAYTATDAALGILLVLDLTTPTSGAPDLFSSIWAEQVQREREDHPRHIVVARLPGNTRDPSATRTP